MSATIDLFKQISDMTQSLGCSKRSIQSYQQEILLLAYRLDRWSDNLPEDLKYNKTNLAYFAASSLGRIFLSMHIGYHRYCQLLYYPFLGLGQNRHPDKQLRRKGSYEEYATLWKEHAIIVSDIARLAS